MTALESPSSTGVRIAEQQTAARERLDDLRQRRNELALDAMLDASKRPDLEVIETEIGEAELDLQRLGFAAAEHERREIIRLDEEAYQRQRAALVQASELADQRAKATKDVDRTAAAFIAAAADYAVVSREMALLVREGGQPNGAEVAMPNGFLVKRAFGQAAVHRWADLEALDWSGHFGYVSAAHVERLADADPIAQVGIDLYIKRLDASRETPLTKSEGSGA